MKIRVDTTGVSFLGASEPEPVVDFNTGAPKTDEHGQPLYGVQLVALDDSGAEVLSVKVAGQPKGIAQGTAVKVTGLVAIPWSMGDRSGVSFRAEHIDAASSTRSSS